MLKKINTMCSKGAGFIYAWMKSHKKHTKRIDNKRILIIFGGRLGNAVLNVDALLELKKYILKLKDTGYVSYAAGI